MTTDLFFCPFSFTFEKQFLKEVREVTDWNSFDRTCERISKQERFEKALRLHCKGRAPFQFREGGDIYL